RRGPDESTRTDQRNPELGGDPSIVNKSKISMCDAIGKISDEDGSVIEAKFELGDDGKLSLSVYPLGKPRALDAERNVFNEASGDPTADPFATKLETFHD